MANRKPLAPHQTTQDYLIKTKSQFEEELDKRIKDGVELQNREITNPIALSKLIQDHELWNDFNSELIKRAFNNPNSQYYKDYAQSMGIYLANLNHSPSLFDKISEERAEITQHLNRLKKLKEKLILIDEISDLEQKSNPKNHETEKSPLKILDSIFSKFHKVAQSLRHRHGGRESLLIKDEYDVQDLLRSILQINFDDIREEDYSPSYAGGNSRVDFVLKDHKTIIEIKMTNDKLKDKEIGSQLLIDIGRYRSHPDCSTLVVFIYDKEDWIRNKSGLINDLNKMSDENLEVRVFITPN